MVAPAVYPRMCEILATFTFGAQRRNHNVSTAFETIAKKINSETWKARCPHAISNLSRILKNTTEVGREVRQCWRRCVGLLCGEKDVTFVGTKKRYLDVSPLRLSMHAETISERQKETQKKYLSSKSIKTAPVKSATISARMVALEDEAEDTARPPPRRFRGTIGPLSCWWREKTLNLWSVI